MMTDSIESDWIQSIDVAYRNPDHGSINGSVLFNCFCASYSLETTLQLVTMPHWIPPGPETSIP